MNRLLILVGVLFLAAALIVPLVIPKRPSQPQHAPNAPAQQTQAPARNQMATIDTSEGHEIAGASITSDAPDDHAHDHPHPDDATLSAIPTSPLAVADHVGFDHATGRSSALTIPRHAFAEAISLEALPHTGQSEILTSSTLGGVERQVHQIAIWILQEDGAITFTVNEINVVLTLTGGRWTVQPADMEISTVSALKDQARFIHTLAAACGSYRAITPGSVLPIAGDDFQPWHHQQHNLLLVGPNEDGTAPATYPPHPGAWNDVRLHLTGSGRPVSAERLIASPATVAEPGFLVRRIILRFDPPSP